MTIKGPPFGFNFHSNLSSWKLFSGGEAEIEKYCTALVRLKRYPPQWRLYDFLPPEDVMANILMI